MNDTSNVLDKTLDLPLMLPAPSNHDLLHIKNSLMNFEHSTPKSRGLIQNNLNLTMRPSVNHMSSVIQHTPSKQIINSIFTSAKER